VPIRPCEAAVPRERRERADVVVAEITGEVVLAREHDPFFGQCLLKGFEVQRLAVGDDPVEIEDDRLERGGHAPGAFAAGASGGAFSPARIATLRRLAEGGYGHSHVGLYARVKSMT